MKPESKFHTGILGKNPNEFLLLINFLLELENKWLISHLLWSRLNLKNKLILPKLRPLEMAEMEDVEGKKTNKEPKIKMIDYDYSFVFENFYKEN